MPISSISLFPPRRTAVGLCAALELTLWKGALKLRSGWGYRQSAHDMGAMGGLFFEPARHELGVGLVAHAGRLNIGFGLKHRFEAELALPEGMPIVAPRAESTIASPEAARLTLEHTQAALELGVLF